MDSDFDIEPLSAALGAVLDGFDLSKPLTGTQAATIRRALLKYQVVFFQDQSLSPQNLEAFARNFGTLSQYPLVRGLDDTPFVMPVIKEAHETVNFGGLWHSDTTYLEQPPMGSILYAQEVPPQGGDTLFANQALAYETLSPALRAALRPLVGVSRSDLSAASRTRADRIRDRAADEASKAFEARHPVVRKHPETNQPVLYVNRAHTQKFEGWSEEESRPLLSFLFKHQVQDAFCCRFRWRPGSLAFWDNRACQHNPINDYHGHRRAMLRVTLAGDKPVGFKD